MFVGSDPNKNPCGFMRDLLVLGGAMHSECPSSLCEGINQLDLSLKIPFGINQ